MKSGCFWLVMIFIALAIGGSFIKKAPKTEAELASEEVSRVYYSALPIIRTGLKAPTTAKFSNFFTDPHTGANIREDGLWEAFGSVDAHNLFGVPLRSDWHVVFNENRSAPVYVRLGNEVIGSLPKPATPPPKPGDWMQTGKRNPLETRQRR